MTKLYENIDLPDGRRIPVIREQSRTRQRAFEGILVADQKAVEVLSQGDIAPAYGQQLAEVRRVANSLFHDPLGRYLVGNVCEGIHSLPDSLAQDIKASAYRTSAIAVLKVTLQCLEDNEDSRLLERAYDLHSEISKRRSDNAQLSIIKKLESANTLLDCCDAIQAKYAELCNDTNDYHLAMIMRTVSIYRLLQKNE